MIAIWIGDTSFAIVDSSLRERADWLCHVRVGRGSARGGNPIQKIRFLLVFDPSRQREERLVGCRTRSTAIRRSAVAYLRHREEPVPLLQFLVVLRAGTASVPSRDAVVVVDVMAPADRAIGHAMHVNNLRVIFHGLFENRILVVRVVIYPGELSWYAVRTKSLLILVCYRIAWAISAASTNRGR